MRLHAFTRICLRVLNRSRVTALYYLCGYIICTYIVPKYDSVYRQVLGIPISIVGCYPPLASRCNILLSLGAILSQSHPLQVVTLQSPRINVVLRSPLDMYILYLLPKHPADNLRILDGTPNTNTKTLVIFLLPHKVFEFYFYFPF